MEISDQVSEVPISCPLTLAMIKQTLILFTILNYCHHYLAFASFSTFFVEFRELRFYYSSILFGLAADFLLAHVHIYTTLFAEIL